MDINLNMLKDSLRIERDDSFFDTQLQMYLDSAKAYIIGAIGYEPDNDDRFALAVIMLATAYYENPDPSKMKTMSSESYKVFTVNNLINQLRGAKPNESQSIE